MANQSQLSVLNGHKPQSVDLPIQLLKSTAAEPKNQQSEVSISRPEWSEATQELLDALPQVWTRGLLYFLLVFVAIILPWAMFSEVDETGTARGRLEPKGNTVKLDAPVAGTVAEINVKEGE